MSLSKKLLDIEFEKENEGSGYVGAGLVGAGLLGGAKKRGRPRKKTGRPKKTGKGYDEYIEYDDVEGSGKKKRKSKKRGGEYDYDLLYNYVTGGGGKKLDPIYAYLIKEYNKRDATKVYADILKYNPKFSSLPNNIKTDYYKVEDKFDIDKIYNAVDDDDLIQLTPVNQKQVITAKRNYPLKEYERKKQIIKDAFKTKEDLLEFLAKKDNTLSQRLTALNL